MQRKTESCNAESFKQLIKLWLLGKKIGQLLLLLPRFSDPYISSVLDIYDDAETDSRKLKIIMTQKWISSWGTITISTQITGEQDTLSFDPSNLLMHREALFPAV